MFIEDFEEVKRRRDQILALTADLKVQHRQWVIDCIFEQHRPYEEPQPEPTASEQAQIDGGPPNQRGPFATAALPPGGGADSEATPTCSIIVGPANLFTAGPTLVQTVGTIGPTGAVTSTATLGPVNTSGDEIFTATNLSSTCTAIESGPVGSTTVTNGTIILQDPNPDVSGEPGEQIVNIPTNPAPNTTYEGTVANVNDNFRAVFNEQTLNSDGALTVTAYHLYLLGPIAVGHLYVGRTVCGVTTVVAPTTTTEATTTTTTSTPGNMPTNKDQCKNGSYAAFGFRNQGQCVSSVARQQGGG